MIKVMLGSLIGIAALLLPMGVFADPKPAAPPQRILITLQVLETPGNAPVSVSASVPASEVYKTLLQNPGTEATEISVQTPADFPGTARYIRTFSYTSQENGKPSLNWLTAPTSLEATPHINSDGTITVHLNTAVTSFVSPDASAAAGTVPATTSRSIATTRTFKNGETILFSGTAQAIPSSKTENQPKTKEVLQFVTLMVLPNK